MSSTGLRENEQYYLIPQYTMKCRLYPNKEAARKIDEIIHAVQVAYNIALYDMKTNHTNVKEIKTENGSTLHYAKFDNVVKKEYLDWLRNQHSDIDKIPASALSGKSGLFKGDLKRSMYHKEVEKKVNGKKIRTHDKEIHLSKTGKPIVYSLEQSNPRFYSSKNPRRSYTYQDWCYKLTQSDNCNVLYFDLMKVGTVKIRGWNQRIRFGENQKLNFSEYVTSNPKKQITITVSKDNCGDYWICFKLQNVYKPMAVIKQGEVGIDVGVKDIAICSDGKKYENKKFKKAEKKHIRAINRRMSRRQGWANEEFRAAYKNDPDLKPSKLYQDIVLSNARLQRKIARRREYENHHITTEIVSNHSYIAVETLNVSGMFRNWHLANALSDAAMGTILAMINYKSQWYNRELHAINRWTSSSKRCSCCGYILPKLSLSVREWTCPVCKTHHDRDENASKNILYYSHVG